MNDKKHIDRLFQEKFKDFEATPDAAVWHTIHNTLHKDKRKRRVIPIWWFAGGAAALLILLLTVGNVFKNGEAFDQPEPHMVGTENNQSTSESKENGINDGIETLSKATANAIADTDTSEDTHANSKKNTYNQNGTNTGTTAITIADDAIPKSNSINGSNSKAELNSLEKDKIVVSNSKEESVAKNTADPQSYNSNKEDFNQIHKRTKTILKTDKAPPKIAKVTDQTIATDSETLKENKELIALSDKGENIEEAIAKANPTNEEEKKEQPNRWNITPNVAPVYFNSLGKGSTIANQFVNNNKSGEVNMSYGINSSYAVTDKLKIRAGINKVNLGYRTDGVMAIKDVNSFSGNASGNEALKNITFNNQSKSDAYLSTSSINSDTAPQFVVSNLDGALEQQFGYIEVPLEVEYSIIDRKFGFNVIGGFSTLFLSNNDIYSVLDSSRVLVGEANNINSTSYSANFGLGFNYDISHALKLNLEPMFKYQINTFTNTSGEFRPYFIGVYTGFSFKF